MIETSPASPLNRIGPEYGDFLYAAVGTESNGGLLSVLSAMARMNFDPWDEAVTLAELPSKTATHRLAALITAIPGRASSEQPEVIAARLIKLLPKPGQPRLPRKSYFHLLLNHMKTHGSAPPLLGKPRASKAAPLMLVLIMMALMAAWYWTNKSSADPSAPPVETAQSR